MRDEEVWGAPGQQGRECLLLAPGDSSLSGEAVPAGTCRWAGTWLNTTGTTTRGGGRTTGSQTAKLASSFPAQVPALQEVVPSDPVNPALPQCELTTFDGKRLPILNTSPCRPPLHPPTPPTTSSSLKRTLSPLPPPLWRCSRHPPLSLPLNQGDCSVV